MTAPVLVPLDAPVVFPSGMRIEELRLSSVVPRGGLPFDASRFTVPPGATSELDEHEVAELWTVRPGRGLIRSGEEVLEVGPLDSVVFRPWVPHQVTVLGDEPFEAFSVWWMAHDDG